MTIYLAIITTVLVVTQIIRVVQNTINLHKNNKLINTQLSRLDDVSEEDFEMQREAYRLIVDCLKHRECSKYDR